MLIFTIFMIVLWLVGIVLLETTRFANNSYKKIEDELKSNAENKTAASTETMSKAFAFLGIGCVSIVVSIVYLISEFIYLMYALQYDPFLYPTFVILTIYIGSFIVAMMKMLRSKITKKKDKLPEKTPVWSYITRFLTIMYFAYMLWAIIAG